MKQGTHLSKKFLLYLSIALNVALACMLLLKPSSIKMEESPTEVIVANKKVNIVMLGNSITHAGNWNEVLNRNDVFNAGMPGWTSQQLSWVIKDFVVPNNPKLCFFKAGINDYILGISTQRIYKNICTNLDSIKAVGVQPVFQTTLYQLNNEKVNRQIDSLNDLMKKFCAEKSYDYVNLHPFLSENKDANAVYYLEDGTHLKQAAYIEWAKAIRPVIAKYKL